ncbi:unnamed protein product [Rotaria sp. Silwood2]|nr:unnamed protein product [Rotaria sp. Silwood2]CAF4446080.1 unnamed protein product [Rotaria sp. Silwood2]
MSQYTYNQFERMTTEEKDRYCDSNNEIITEKIRQHGALNEAVERNLQQKRNSYSSNRNNSFKRQLTSTSQYDEEINNESDNYYGNDDQFTTVNNRYNKKKQRINGNINIDKLTIDNNNSSTANTPNGRLFVNRSNRTNKSNNDEIIFVGPTLSRNKTNNYKKINKKNNNELIEDMNESVDDYNTPDLHIIEKKSENQRVNDTQGEAVRISQQALHYAVENHLPPLKFICEPKITQMNIGKEIIKTLLTTIDKDFRRINKHYEHPLGFDHWHVDKNGDLLCFTRHIELFVFLCNNQNYPNSLYNTIVHVTKPKHLPAQHSIVLKYVPNYICHDDIKNEIGNIANSIFNIEDMRGTMSERSRHIRIELASINEYNQLLKSGSILIDGQVIETQEFLAAPRVLICSKCNDPGHVRRNCTFQYDACRRCGNDRTTGNHKECEIKCHRCLQNHLSTDYQCPFLVDYRRSILCKLKEQPNLLPPNLKLFIPLEYRDRNNKNNRTLFNPIHKNIATHINMNNALPFNLSSHEWPTINKTNNAIEIHQCNNQSIWEDLRKKQDEINNLKVELNVKMQTIQSRYDDHMKKMGSILIIMSQQTKNQNENIERCYTTINEVLPVLSSTLEVVQRLISKNGMLNTSENDLFESQSILKHISQSLEYIKDRNDLLTTNQKAMNLLVEQQGSLMIQAINSLLSNDK